jgi:RNA polymerase sigma-70 factor (ECF subfamily)
MIFYPGPKSHIRQNGMSEAKTNGSYYRETALDHLDALYGFAMVLTTDETEAQDLLQETYLRAFGACELLMPDSNLKAWLFVIMRNIWLNQVRHRRSAPEFVEIDEQDDDAPQLENSADDPLKLLIRKVERKRVRDAISRLPRPYREAVVLRDLEGFTYQEIAGIIGCPRGTVMSRLARGRDKLRLLLSRKLEVMAKARASKQL